MANNAAAQSEAEQLASALKKNEMLIEKVTMLKEAYTSKNDELQAERAKLAHALAKAPRPSPLAPSFPSLLKVFPITITQKALFPT